MEKRTNLAMAACLRRVRPWLWNNEEHRDIRDFILSTICPEVTVIIRVPAYYEDLQEDTFKVNSKWPKATWSEEFNLQQDSPLQSQFYPFYYPEATEWIIFSGLQQVHMLDTYRVTITKIQGLKQLPLEPHLVSLHGTAVLSKLRFSLILSLCTQTSSYSLAL